MNHHTQELEKNEILEWADKKFGHLKQHMSKIVLGVVAVLVLVFGWMINSYLRNQSESVPWEMLFRAVSDNANTGSVNDFTLMHEEYPDLTASAWAMQMRGDSQLRSGLTKFIADRNAAIKNLEDAKKSYQSIVTSNADVSERLMQRAVYCLAYTCESLGEFDEAIAQYEKIVKESPDSPFVAQADRALDRLADPDIRKVWELTKTAGTAPEAPLPSAPDISFPEMTLDDSAEETDNTNGADVSEIKPPVDDSTSSENGDSAGEGSTDSESGDDVSEEQENSDQGAAQADGSDGDTGEEETANKLTVKARIPDSVTILICPENFKGRWKHRPFFSAKRISPL
ncbi:MAG: tetratricopeptide repeat protein [Pirellulaceae bacterium]